MMANSMSLFCLLGLFLVWLPHPITTASESDPLANYIIPLEPCKVCEPDKCPKVPDCPVGLVLDRCGCCKVCGLEESHLCNMDEDTDELYKSTSKKPWHGRCGENLACALRTDIDTEMVGMESICYCQIEGIFCASDGNTYSHCQLEAVKRRSGGKIVKNDSGYCNSKPRVTMNANQTQVGLGQDLTLACEAVGYPIPSLVWYFAKLDSEQSEKLPGLSSDISTTHWGDANPTKAFSFLQIINFKREYQGQYKCAALNDLGTSEDTVSIALQSREL